MSPHRRTIPALLLLVGTTCAATVAPVRAIERADTGTAPSFGRAVAERILAASPSDAVRRVAGAGTDSAPALEPGQRDFVRSLADESGSGSVTGAPGGYWVNLDGSPVDGFHSAAYDPIRHRMIVVSGTPYSGVWALNLLPVPSWTQLHPTGSGPIGLWGHAMIYDPARDRMLLFGGGEQGWYGWVMSQAVYSLSLSGTPEWTLLATTGTPPPGRIWHTATYDPVRDRMLIFGGTNLEQTFNDLWALSLGGNPEWTRLEAPGIWPWRRALHSAIYDSRRDRLVVYGGFDDERKVEFTDDDVWALPLATLPMGRAPDHPLGEGVIPSAWTRIVVRPGGPGPRIGQSAVYDAPNDRMVMFGGGIEPTTNEVWALDFAHGADWSRIPIAGESPDGRYAQTMTYLSDEHRVLLYGGFDGTTLRKDTWSLDLEGTPAWSRIPFLEGGFGGPRAYHTLVYDSANDQVVLYGGLGWSSLDTWILPLSGDMRPVPVTTDGPSPPPRFAHSAVYDPVRKRMLVFGGLDLRAPPYLNVVLNDVWALNLDGPPAWSLLTPMGAPPAPREGQSAIYDPVRDRVLIFSGFGQTGALNDLWELRLHDRLEWHRVLPYGTPPSARTDAPAIYDPVGDRMILFGGNCWDCGDDIHQLRFNLGSIPAWSLIQPSGTHPDPRERMSGVYDRARNRFVIFGGRWLDDLNDAWALALDPPYPWTRLDVEGELPTPRASHAAVYDPVRDRMLISGGKLVFDYLGDFWALDWGGSASANASAIAGTATLSAGGADVPPLIPASAADLDPSGLPFPPDRPGLRLAGGNPVRAGASLRCEYFVPSPGADVSISIVDVTGRCVARRADGFVAPGVHAAAFGAADLAAIRAGVYFLRLQASGATLVRKWVRVE